MDGVKFTIITPSYNQGKYIENTIKSVIKQEYQNWELLIQDAASTDNTIDVCTKYLNDKRIKLVSEKDKGFADAVNKGILKAAGEWLLILNSDDFLASNDVLSHVNSLIDKNNELLLITGESGITYFNKNSKASNISNLGKEIIKEINPDEVYNFKESFSQPSTFFRADRAKEIGLLDMDLDMVADTDLWIRYLLFKPKIVKNAIRTNKTLSIVTEHDEQRTMKPHLFYHGRAKMAVKYVNNNKLGINKDYKIKNALNQINQAIEYYAFKRLSNIENIKLYENFTKKSFPIIRRIKYALSFIPFFKNIFYKIIYNQHNKKISYQNNNVIWFN